MDQESKKTQEPKSGVNFVVLFLILGVVSMITMMIMYNNAPFEIGYKEFNDYLQKKSADPDKKNYSILVDRKSGSSIQKIRLSNLRDIVINDQKIEGKFDWNIENGDSDEPVEKLFVVNIRSEGFGQSIYSEIKKSKVKYAFGSGPSFLSKWFPFIIFTSVILLIFFFMVRKIGGAGSPMSFGRSRGRLYADEELEVTFNDVAGIDEAVEEVKEIVDFLQSPDKYQKLGGRIPKGVLLVGPPGTGKTLLAKAIAGEAGVPFFSLSGSDFVEMFVGVGAARVRDMFQQAVQKAPCIIFIDELDALGKSRGGNMAGGHDEREQTLNALLVEMDGFDSNSGVIVMAATNRPETLDQALLRPGRFDRNVLVDRPDVRGREAILKVHVKNVKLGEDVDLSKVASISPGFVGADLANLVNEAALRAAREEKSAVEMRDFDEGVERVTAGLEKKQRVMNQEEKCRVAYHEAGHALVAYSLPNTDPVHKVSIIPRGIAALGYTMQRPEEDRYLMTQSELESRIQVLLAGTIAEEIIYKDISTGAQNDLERATDIARGMVMEYGMSRMGRVNYKDSNRSAFLESGGEEVIRSVSEKTQREIDEEVRRFIEESIEKVRHIIEVRKDCLIALTERLIEVESVEADELTLIIDENAPGPLVVPGTSTVFGGPTSFPKSKTKGPIEEDKAENA